MIEVERVLAVHNRLGEGPRWNIEEQALYWVDIEGDCFYRYYPATGEYERFDTGLPVAVLGFRARGGLVLGTRDGFATWNFAEGKLTPLVDVEKEKAGSLFNDGAVSRQGYFWAGTKCEGASSCLYRLAPDGSVAIMETGITISNGTGWSPDNRTMYFTDSLRRVIYAYDFDPATETISNRRNFAHTPDEEAVPDGLAVDSLGFVWAAYWGGWKIVRYDPDGKREREIPVPAAHVTSCAFGGPDLTDLYITSAWSELGDEEKRAQPMAGDLFVVHTGIKGLPESKFLG